MTTPRDDFDPKAYNPKFEWRFLAPKYWGTWLGTVLSLPMALLPLKAQRWIVHHIAKRLANSDKIRSVHNIRVNLIKAFPEQDKATRDHYVYQTLYTAGLFLMRFSLLTLKPAKWLQTQCDFINEENLKVHTDNGEKVILLVPHSWAIDVPAVLLASQGLPVSAMAKRQKNEVTDWLMHRQRVQYGGRVYERSGGIKPFIKSIKDGYLGYYLPDQDHGPDLSEFVDFFATTKATLPGLTKLAKLSRAKIVPMFASMDSKTGRYTIEFLPALELQESDQADARNMNQAIETFVGKQIEQYMWILRFLRTQQDGTNPYDDLKNMPKSEL